MMLMMIAKESSLKQLQNHARDHDQEEEEVQEMEIWPLHHRDSHTPQTLRFLRKFCLDRLWARLHSHPDQSEQDEKAEEAGQQHELPERRRSTRTFDDELSFDWSRHQLHLHLLLHRDHDRYHDLKEQPCSHSLSASCSCGRPRHDDHQQLRREERKRETERDDGWMEGSF